MPFEKRLHRFLEEKNDGIKMEVSYAGSLELEELIVWLNNMGKYFEWMPMIEEKKV